MNIYAKINSKNQSEMPILQKQGNSKKWAKKNQIKGISKILLQILPKDIFNNSQRISEIAKIKIKKTKDNHQNIQIKEKQNYATNLAEIALQITNNNTERHKIIENLMLINDAATIAVEIPVYLNQENNTIENNTITGHIDILQIRYNKLHIMDFKPEKTDKQEASLFDLIARLNLLQFFLFMQLNQKIYFFHSKVQHLLLLHDLFLFL